MSVLLVPVKDAWGPIDPVTDGTPSDVGHTGPGPVSVGRDGTGRVLVKTPVARTREWYFTTSSPQRTRRTVYASQVDGVPSPLPVLYRRPPVTGLTLPLSAPSRGKLDRTPSSPPPPPPRVPDRWPEGVSTVETVITGPVPSGRRWCCYKGDRSPVRSRGERSRQWG